MSNLVATQISEDVIRQIREEPKLKKPGRFTSTKSVPIEVSKPSTSATEESKAHPALIILLGVLSLAVGMMATLVIASYVRLL